MHVLALCMHAASTTIFNARSAKLQEQKSNPTSNTTLLQISVPTACVGLPILLNLSFCV